MNLYDFEDQIPTHILDRGYEYWLEDWVFIESQQEATYRLTSEESDELHVLQAHLITYRDTDTDDHEVEELQALLRIVEKRMDS